MSLDLIPQGSGRPVTPDCPRGHRPQPPRSLTMWPSRRIVCLLSLASFSPTELAYPLLFSFLFFFDDTRIRLLNKNVGFGCAVLLCNASNLPVLVHYRIRVKGFLLLSPILHQKWPFLDCLFSSYRLVWLSAPSVHEKSKNGAMGLVSSSAARWFLLRRGGGGQQSFSETFWTTVCSHWLRSYQDNKDASRHVAIITLPYPRDSITSTAPYIPT
jgi:hypothetical protein